MRKILHFLPRWDNGGMEHAVLDIVSHFKNKENEYIIFAAFQESDYGLAEMNKHNILFFSCFNNKKYSFSSSVIALLNFLNKEEYDIVHLHINNAIGLVFALAAKFAGAKKIVIHTHNNSFGDGNKILKRILRIISILLFNKIPDLFLACSNDAGKWTFGKNIEKNCKYHVVYNGVNTDRFYFNALVRNNLRKKYGLSECFIIGHIGHFNYQKNQVFMLDTILDVVKLIPNAHYFFVGSGETKYDFLVKIKKLKLEEYVTVIDAVDNPQDYYSMFDLFVFPSHFEGFGIVMIEAQISGLQIVCSELVPKETDISNRVTYLPIGNDSISKWSETIIKCYSQFINNDREQKVSNNRYDIVDISEKIESYYLKLLESN